MSSNCYLVALTPAVALGYFDTVNFMPVRGCNWTTLFAVSITLLKSIEKRASGVPTVPCILKKHFFIPFLHFSLNSLNVSFPQSLFIFSLLFRVTA